MTIVNTNRWSSLEQWSASLFLVAGGLLIVHTVIHVLLAFTNVNYPFHHEFPFGTAGMVLGFVALFGLYPQLVTRTPKLARVGAVLAGLGTVGWVVFGARTLVKALGVTLPAWLAIVGPFLIFGVILGYLVFGVASLRTEIVSRTTALVLLTPMLVMVYNMAVALTTGGTREGQIIVAGGFALAHLAIGAALRVEKFPSGRPEPATGMHS